MNEKIKELAKKLNIEEETSYGYMGMGEKCPFEKKASKIGLWTNTLDNAIDMAKFDQPAYMPYLIVKKVEHYEVVGIVKND